MKGLFLIFHGFEEFNGISKKIRYQVKALKECGMDIRTCWLDDTDNRKRRMIDDEVLADYGVGIKGKILKRIEFESIVNYAKKRKDRIYLCTLRSQCKPIYDTPNKAIEKNRCTHRHGNTDISVRPRIQRAPLPLPAYLVLRQMFSGKTGEIHR